jgi:hypothetical protein
MGRTVHTQLRLAAATAMGWLVLSINGLSQSVPPPADGILDETRALTEMTHRQLADELRQFRENLDCDAWITATSFTPADMTLRRRAQINRRDWSGERPAVLMAYDRATNGGAMSFAPELWGRYSSAELIEIMQESRRILSNNTLTLDERLTLATRSWIDRLRAMESVRLRHTLPLQQNEKRLAQATVIAFASGAVIIALLGLVSRRRLASSDHRFLFPEVHVGMRFGAPYGGGVTSEIKAHADGR